MICGPIGLTASCQKLIGKCVAKYGLNGTTFTALAKKYSISAAKMKIISRRLVLLPRMSLKPKYAKDETINTVQEASKEKTVQSRML